MPLTLSITSSKPVNMKLPDRLALVSLACLFANCAAAPGTAPKQGLPPAPPSASGEHYAIRPGDLLTITFADEPELTQQVRVDWNGMISVPLLATEGGGEVKAAGASVSALAERVSELAKNNKLLVNARAQVLVYEQAAQAYTVLGQVTQPGRYTFPRGVPPRLALEEAIALAGGCTRLARTKQVLIKRGGEVYSVDFDKLVSLPNQSAAVIIPGDVITVNERRF
jgi:polysaccharide export outer membrane protein